MPRVPRHGRTPERRQRWEPPDGPPVHPLATSSCSCFGKKAGISMASGTEPGRGPMDLISLPQGGGGMHGLGETFTPDPHTGTGNLTVPIVVPGGRRGHQPKLSLVYSTGSGSGPF